jgi:hypothetical protein
MSGECWKEIEIERLTTPCDFPVAVEPRKVTDGPKASVSNGGICDGDVTCLLVPSLGQDLVA